MGGCERERERCDERDLRERDMGGRREKAVGSQESRLEGKTRRRESALAYFISVKPIYIELKLRERADKVRRTGESRQRERGGGGRSNAEANSIAIAMV